MKVSQSIAFALWALSAAVLSSLGCTSDDTDSATAGPGAGNGGHSAGGSGATAAGGSASSGAGLGGEGGSGGTGAGGAATGVTVTYLGKTADVTDFSAATGLDLGKDGYYFPQFGQSNSKSKRTAKDNMQFIKPSWQKDWEFKVFEQCGGKFCNLFSPDAGVFDLLEGEEGIGVYSESGGNAWPSIKFTGGEGNSGSVVDEAAKGGVNNTVNHIRISAGAPAEFCMSILTDNTAGDHDIHDKLAARIGWYQDENLDVGTAEVPSGDLVFNGVPDLYTFKFSNMTGDHFIKIRLNGGPNTDPGFGGLMFDPCN